MHTWPSSSLAQNISRRSWNLHPRLPSNWSCQLTNCPRNRRRFSLLGVIYRKLEFWTSEIVSTFKYTSVHLLISFLSRADWQGKPFRTCVSTNGTNRVHLLHFCKLSRQINLLVVLKRYQGTTNNPKGVVLKHSHMAIASQSNLYGSRYPPNAILFSYLPLAHIYEAWDWFMLAWKSANLSITLASGRVANYQYWWIYWVFYWGPIAIARRCSDFKATLLPIRSESLEQNLPGRYAGRRCSHFQRSNFQEGSSRQVGEIAYYWWQHARFLGQIGL